MRTTTKIQRTSFVLSGNELTRVLFKGIGLETHGENLGTIVGVEANIVGDEVFLEVVYHKEIE